MAKNKNHVIQNSHWDRTLMSTTREPTATQQDSYDLSHSDDLLNNPAPMRSVHNASNQRAADVRYFDNYQAVAPKDAIFLVEKGARERADHLLTEYNSTIHSNSKRSHLAVTDQSDFKFQYTSVQAPVGAFLSHRIQNQAQHSVTRSRRQDRTKPMSPFAGFPTNAGARHRQLQALSMSFDAGLDNNGVVQVSEAAMSPRGHLNYVARQRSQLQTQQEDSRMHVQELGGLVSETPDLQLQVHGRKSGIHQHKPTSKRHIVSITLPETSGEFNLRQ